MARRHAMVDLQLRARGICDPRVLAARRRVPRHVFVPSAVQEFAYEDTALPIACEQTISQPFIVSTMAQAACIGPADRVLEVGTGSGSGYAATVLAELAAHVDTIERHTPLAATARRLLHALGYEGRIAVHEGDGSKGLPREAPFDVIIAAAGGPRVPIALREQLTVGGRPLMPVGDTPTRQRLVLVTRQADGGFACETLGRVAFVPLVGEQGWADAGVPPIPEICQ